MHRHHHYGPFSILFKNMISRELARLPDPQRVGLFQHHRWRACMRKSQVTSLRPHYFLWQRTWPYMTSSSRCAERTQVTTINVLRSEEAPVYDGTWVMVFGFLTDRSVLAAVLQEFQLCGTIVLWVTPPAANCNWIYIQFETAEGAQRALKRSGQRMGMLPMVIGVQPLSPDDRRFIAQQSGQSWTSKGMSASVPQRSFTLSCTTGKVCFTLSSKFVKMD